MGKNKKDTMIVAGVVTGYILACGLIGAAINRLSEHDRKIKEESAEEARNDFAEWLNIHVGYNDKHPETVEIVKKSPWGVISVDKYKISRTE